MKRRTFLKGSASIAALMALPQLIPSGEWTHEKIMVFKPVAHNFGPVTLTIDNGPIRILQHPDGTEMRAGDLAAGQTVTVKI